MQQNHYSKIFVIMIIFGIIFSLSIICETKQEVYKAVRNFESFDVFFLKKSKEGQDFFRSEALKYENIIKTLRDESMGT